jgi:hypothetical protein
MPDDVSVGVDCAQDHVMLVDVETDERSGETLDLVLRSSSHAPQDHRGDRAHRLGRIPTDRDPGLPHGLPEPPRRGLVRAVKPFDGFARAFSSQPTTGPSALRSFGVPGDSTSARVEGDAPWSNYILTFRLGFNAYFRERGVLDVLQSSALAKR